MSQHHHTIAVGRLAYGSLLCAAVGSIALYLAPVSVSAQTPQLADIRCVNDVDAERTKFRTIIGYIETKNKAMLRQAVSQSSNTIIECHATNGYNTLHYAAIYGDTEGAKILIDAGADRRKESSIVESVSPCPETPYGLALAMNRLGMGELRSPALLEALDYDPRSAPWVAAGSGGSATGDPDEGAGATGDSDEDVGATAKATADPCQVRDVEIRRWAAGRAH